MSGVERFVRDFKDHCDKHKHCECCGGVLMFSWEEIMCDECKRFLEIPVTYGGPPIIECPVPSERERDQQGVGRIEFGIWRPE